MSEINTQYLLDKLEQCIKLQVTITNQQQTMLREHREMKDKMDAHMDICKTIDKRLQNVERYEFAAKAVLWFLAGVAAIVAGAVHFWNDVREMFD